MAITEHDKQRFLEHYRNSLKQNDCIFWPLSSKLNGYGCFWMRSGAKSAHRVSYELFNGPIPNNMVVCHSCDNKMCVNPDHLWLGTQQDNLKDMVNKKRHKYVGADNGRSKLNDKKVIIIKNLLSQGVKQTELAKKYNVSTAVICKIANNKSWRHV